MAPKSEDVFESSIMGSNYINIRTNQSKDPMQWLRDKQKDDRAEGLWRIHNGLYDLTDFIKRHPGGPIWLKLTKGTDITEAFEVHHISSAAEKILPKYFVRKAAEPRTSPYTFEENGFYRTLKRNARDVLKNVPNTERQTKLMIDGLCITTFILSILAARTSSYLIGLLTGMCLTLTTNAAHNFFHQKDNFRMYYFDLSFLSSLEWRISHALSHHLFTNTVVDLEIISVQPLLQFLPISKPILIRYGTWLCLPFFYVILFFGVFIRRLYYYARHNEFDWAELIKFSIPLSMYLFSGTDIATVLKMWFFITGISSLHFAIVGISAAHHHPNIFHDGDAVREEKDWGIQQMTAVMDRHEITGNPFLVLTNYGDHCLHHFFPTVDHGKLNYLYPVLEQTCKEFDIELRFASQIDLVKGKFAQLARTKPNPIPTILKNKAS